MSEIKVKRGRKEKASTGLKCIIDRVAPEHMPELTAAVIQWLKDNNMEDCTEERERDELADLCKENKMTIEGIDDMTLAKVKATIRMITDTGLKANKAKKVKELAASFEAKEPAEPAASK